MSKIPETLTLEGADKLHDEIVYSSGIPNAPLRVRRNGTIFLLMLDAGLRVGECVQLLQSDLFVHGEAVQTLILPAEITKSKRSREIPLTARLQRSIRILKDYHWSLTESCPVNFAFYVKSPKRHITTRQVERFIGSASIDSIGHKIHPHTLRHTFASRLMRVTNARVVQQLLGHKCLSSTQIYCHPNQQDLTDAIGRIEAQNKEV